MEAQGVSELKNPHFIIDGVGIFGFGSPPQPEAVRGRARGEVSLRRHHHPTGNQFIIEAKA